MDEIFQHYRGAFDQAFEVVQTLILVANDADFRIEILKRWPEGDYKPRVYKQVEVSVDSSPMLLWREYEMGYQVASDPEAALKMAMAVISNRTGR